MAGRDVSPIALVPHAAIGEPLGKVQITIFQGLVNITAGILAHLVVDIANHLLQFGRAIYPIMNRAPARPKPFRSAWNDAITCPQRPLDHRVGKTFGSHFRPYQSALRQLERENRLHVKTGRGGRIFNLAFCIGSKQTPQIGLERAASGRSAPSTSGSEGHDILDLSRANP